MLTASDVIQLLHLEPLPSEGGFFRRTWTSAQCDEAGRSAGSAIYYMLTDAPDGFSALHRLCTDEVYHFYAGAPVELHIFYDDTVAHKKIILGNDFAAGQIPHYVVPAYAWQGSCLAPDLAPNHVSGGTWALLGTTMAPAFIDDEFSLAPRNELLARYPAHRDSIIALTRTSFKP